MASWRRRASQSSYMGNSNEHYPRNSKRVLLFESTFNFQFQYCFFVCHCSAFDKIVYLCRLTYLHEGLEPKVVHRDVKSSNILLDKQWNPKVSDFGLAKLLESENSYITTRVMGTFGFV